MSYQSLKLSDYMPFGKHKGECIEDLIYDEPNYLAWLIDSTDTEFDDQVLEILRERKVI